MRAPSEMLGPGGELARTHAAYENRPSQRVMADAVAGAINDGHALLVEAGTGTGKTLAYLVPALASGKRVVVSTGTRALQEQLALKDIALLREMTGIPVRTAVLKGTSNYVCRRRLEGAAMLAGADAGTDLAAVLEWVARSDVGDRAELSAVAENAAIWQRITTAADGRLGPQCPYIDRCYVAKARKRAERSDIIIVNHHLFFTDFALRRQGIGARVLPDYEAVIFDEAHQLEDIIATHMGPSISSRGVAALAAELERADKNWIEKRLLEWLAQCSSQFFTLVAARCPSATSGGRVDIPEHLFADEAVREAWLRLDTALDDVGASAALRADAELEPLASAGLRAAAIRAERMRNAAAEIAEPDEPPCGQWMESSTTGIRLCAAPASAGTIIGEVLSETSAAIFTSATLTTEENFTFIRSRLGLEPTAATSLALDSPFDYERQALLYVPRDLPEPTEPSYIAAAADRLSLIANQADGGTFALFTSWSALEATATIARRATERTILVQGEAPKSALLAAFRADGHALLLATSSFWEGVDVAGDALRCVVIHRLPFAVPTDPLHRARMKALEEAGEDPFTAYQLPGAALHLKQGFGRLIRSRSDRGVVAVLDKRIVTRRYGRIFFETLPAGLPRTSAIEQVRRFWARAGQESG